MKIHFLDGVSVNPGKWKVIVSDIHYLFVYTSQAGVKAKKATETYKSFVEKYATAKSEFEQKMAETAQVL